MSIYAGPETNDTNINFCVDASNPKSYSGSGTSWIDLTQGRVATLTNGPTYSSDNGGSFTFDGINDYATFSTVQVTTNLTITAWIKTTSTDSTSSAVYSPALPIVGETVTSAWYSFGITGGKVRYYNARKDSIWTNYDSTASVNNGIWRHVAVTHSSTTEQIKLYIDGVLDSTFSNSATGGFPNYFALYMTASKIGTMYGLADFFDGSIACVKILNLLYSDADVAQDFASNRGRFRPTLPTGGTITLSEGYRIHTFTSSSTFATNDFGGQIDYLIVGGGGGGGGNIYHGGGGGAGGLLNSIATLTTGTSYTVTVGGGGAGTTGTNGSNSSFNSQTGVGGGGGGDSDSAGSNGGSGGGCGVRNATVGTGTSGQGNNGGAGVTSGDTPHYGAGGGGGRGSTGANGTNVSGGDGGTGALVWGSLYAGGGGGSAYACACSGAGGSGIGGAGAFGPGAGNGSTNTGSGGGGRDSRGAENKGSGNGGSGVVIIRYKYPF